MSSFAATLTGPTRSMIFILPVTRCSDSKSGRRGFGPKNDKMNKSNTPKEQKGAVLQQSKSAQQSRSPPVRAPRLSSQSKESSKNMYVDIEFEERLESIKRSAIEQKKAEETKDIGEIDYDAPIESDKKSTTGIGFKIGAGVAAVVFGLVFALGDFLPSVSDIPAKEGSEVTKNLSEEGKATLQKSLKGYEATLAASPKDPTALEGAAVTLAELGEYSRAASLLQDLTKEKPRDPDVFRLLGEVKYEVGDYEGSAAAYRSSATLSGSINLEVIRGLTNALLAAKKPDEAVKVLLDTRASLNADKSDVQKETNGDRRTTELQVDPIQVELLLGKAYSDWGHVSDAVSIYDGLISSHPDDFRGYLAKGIILKENGKVGDAERMFIQARFFAPEKAKELVDRFSRR